MILKFEVFILSLFVGLFLAAHFGAAEILEVPDGIIEPISVTVEELVSNPEPYDQKRVKVTGFLAWSGISLYLFSSLESYFDWHLLPYGEDNLGPIRINTWEESFFSDSFETVTIERPFDSASFLNRTNVEVIGSFHVTPNSYLNENGEYVVVLDGPGNFIEKMEPIKITDRPYIPSTYLKEIFNVRNERRGLKEFFEVIQTSDVEYDGLGEFVQNWKEWIKKKNFSELKRTIYKDYDEQGIWEHLDDPEYFYYKILFSDNSLFQEAISETTNTDFTLLRQTAFFKPDEKNDKLRAACFCLQGDCNDLWPVTLEQTTFISPVDDFVCVRIIDGKEGWQWDF